MIHANKSDRKIKSSLMLRPEPISKLKETYPKFEPYHKEYFLWMLRQEIFKVERTNQPLSILLFKIPDIINMEKPNSDIRSDKLTEIIIRIFKENFRKTDIKGWYDEGRLAILMPDTSRSGASIVHKKLKESLFSSLNIKDINFNNHFNKACSIHSYPDSLLKKNECLDREAEFKGSIKNPYSLWENTLEYHNKSKLQLFAKRILDFFCSGICLVLLLPLLLIIGIIIKFTSPGPVLFKQVRLGFCGIPFTFYKFRSMYNGADDKCHREYVNNLIEGCHEEINLGSKQEPVLKMYNDKRITPFGKFLRRSSLDELPQLFNVLRGEMSMVGPRPPIPYGVEKYKNWHLKRILEVKPGITGIWQIYGRSRTTFDEMVRMDLLYIKNWNIGMDIKILFKTIKVVLSAKGAY